MATVPIDVSKIPAAKIDHFWSKVRKGADDVCWDWTDVPANQGYGKFWIGKGWAVRAHRLAFTLAKGPIPEGLVIDHLCRNRACCNPAHLRAVTDAENIGCGTSVSVKNNGKTHCPRGHEYTGVNVWRNAKGHRHCLTCRREMNSINRKAGTQAKKELAALKEQVAAMREALQGVVDYFGGKFSSKEAMDCESRCRQALTALPEEPSA